MIALDSSTKSLSFSHTSIGFATITLLSNFAVCVGPSWNYSIL